MFIKRVNIKNFRTFDSFDDKGKEPFEIELDEKFQIIAGANNSGKTNLLRALNLFFNGETDSEKFYDRNKDMPYHKGKHGSSSPVFTEIEVDIFLMPDEIKKIKGISTYLIDSSIIRTKVIYKDDDEYWYFANQNGIFPTKNNMQDNLIFRSNPIFKLFNRIKFIFVPADIEIEKTINELVAEEILPTMIDSYGYGKSEIGKKIKRLSAMLKTTDKLTSEILKEKNELITEKFTNVIQEFPEIMAGIDLKSFKLEVELQDESMANILSKRINLSVRDASHASIDSKGSGIQKIALITLLDYFSDNNESKARFTNPFIIWAFDEPETFLQPKLQKKLGNIFQKVSDKHQIIITTHSPKLIDPFNIDNVKLFILQTSKTKPLTRKNDEIFIKKTTNFIDKKTTNFILKLKEHLGIEVNDGWLLREKNILFEGSDDQIYFHSTFQAIMNYPLEVSNIICHSSTNMPSFAEFLFQQISNKEFKADSLICLLDDDNAGRDAYNKITSYKKSKQEAKRYIKPLKIISLYLEKNENATNRYPKMIEDFAIPEVFFESVISFLIKKDSSIDISKYHFNDFFNYRKSTKLTPIMEVLDNFFDEIISKNDNFSFKTLTVKYGLSLEYEIILRNKNQIEKDKYIAKYPDIKKFLKEFEK